MSINDWSDNALTDHLNDEWDDEYYPNLPRPRFRSPHRHMERWSHPKEETKRQDVSQRVEKPRKFPSVSVLNIGHSNKFEKTGDMFANCTVTFIKGLKFNILVDTMTAWDGAKLERMLKEIKLHPDDIHYVVCTQGHSDHTGGNYLFRNAFHIVGTTMSHGERFMTSPLNDGKEFLIEPKVKVICTPGHTLDSVTVLVDTGKEEKGLVAITGDLFEREADIEFPKLWRELAGSQNPEEQEKNRKKILEMADFIVPGHGPMFQNIYKNITGAGGTGPSASH
ncbi:metallo-beta-lactamase domain-containing protein 1-like [Neocloeon triangulifer]|uniref:metallo-beta-lactamase domain-containing protein 1-like n=1 Tax=Neocloeon triangulifer TaxID=2078957 RepID=UPI00286EFAC9|nr:metallo-beta-lactamase domain-containing protein 1-like [Neocloeon triangulifer]